MPFTLYSEPSSGSDINDPTYTTLTPYDTVLWFTGAEYGSTDPTVSVAQATFLTEWLDTGNKTLIIFAESLVYDDSTGNGWAGPENFALLGKTYIGAKGDLDDPQDDVTSQDVNSDGTVVVTGQSGTAFATQTWTVVNNAVVDTDFSVINPATGVDTLATISADATSAGTNSALPVVVGHKTAGAAGTSTVVHVGFAVENILNGGSTASQAQFLAAVQSYVGSL